MPTVLSESSTFTASVVVPANGDARTAASVNNAFQALTNRTKRLRDWLIMLDADEDGAADCLLRPPAGKADAGSAPILLTKGTNNTKAEAGAIEYDGTNLYFTPVATRKTVSFSDHTHAAAAVPYVEEVYQNDGVTENITSEAHVSSSWLSIALSTSAMPLASTSYVVEVSANVNTESTANGGEYRIAKTIGVSTTEVPGSRRAVMALSTGYAVAVPITTVFQASSNDAPITVALQGKVTASTDSMPINSASCLCVKVSQGTVTVTGKGSVS